jgi:hypothetical protein
MCWDEESNGTRGPKLSESITANIRFPASEIPLPDTEHECDFATPVPRLTRRELRYLIGVLDRETGYCGLDTEPGRQAAALRLKLRALHAHAHGSLENNHG